MVEVVDSIGVAESMEVAAVLRRGTQGALAGPLQVPNQVVAVVGMHTCTEQVVVAGSAVVVVVAEHLVCSLVDALLLSSLWLKQNIHGEVITLVASFISQTKLLSF